MGGTGWQGVPRSRCLLPGRVVKGVGLVVRRDGSRSAGGGRRLSRRASFFAMLRNVGN
jgi:hypothetical protein